MGNGDLNGPHRKKRQARKGKNEGGGKQVHPDTMDKMQLTRTRCRLKTVNITVVKSLEPDIRKRVYVDKTHTHTHKHTHTRASNDTAGMVYV